MFNSLPKFAVTHQIYSHLWQAWNLIPLPQVGYNLHITYAILPYILSISVKTSIIHYNVHAVSEYIVLGIVTNKITCILSTGMNFQICSIYT